jgi:site-specific DNA recombinase
MTDKRPTLHIYTRVSTETQAIEGTSLETQKELGIAKARELGFSHKLWNEGAKSSHNDDLTARPQLASLLSEMREGKVKHLWVIENSRLSRNDVVASTIRGAMRDAGAILYTKDGRYDLDNPSDRFTRQILDATSQLENALRTERSRLGKLASVTGGKWMGGSPPYGYAIENRMLVPNKEEVRWLKTIYENYAAGMSVDDIRTVLLSNGVITRRGNPVWSHGSITAVLKNTHYGGYYTYTDKKSDQTVRCDCPPLLKPKLIEAVALSREARSYKKRGGKRTETSNRKYTYLLSDFLVCGSCGSRFGGNIRKTQKSYYSCLNKTGKYTKTHTEAFSECGLDRNLGLDEADSLIWDSVIEVLEHSHLFREEIKKETLGDRSYRQSSVDLKRIKARMAKIEKELETVSAGVVSINTQKLIGSVSGDEAQKIVDNLESHRRGLQIEKAELLEAIEADNHNRVWVNWLKEFGSKIETLKSDKLGIEERKRVLTGIVRDITVSEIDRQRTKLEINFLFPYVGDELAYNYRDKKSRGYKVQGGSKKREVEVWSARGGYRKTQKKRAS